MLAFKCSVFFVHWSKLFHINPPHTFAALQLYSRHTGTLDCDTVLNGLYSLQSYLISLRTMRKLRSLVSGCGSGVATGWHGWTMSRGPRAKGALRERKKKEMKNRKWKKGRKEKRGWNFSNTRAGAPTRYIPMSLSRWQKIQKSNIGNHHTIFEI